MNYDILKNLTRSAKKIQSDNALCFTSKAKTFGESSFTTKEIQKTAESKKIAWKFIPTGAPHFGFS